MPRIWRKPATDIKESFQYECCEGRMVKCLKCHYEGLSDVVSARKKKRTGLLLERCPNCKSINLKSLEESLDMENETTWELDEWNGCYPSDWRNKLVEGAMSHPAKFSSKLIAKIYDHMKEEGWLQEGDRVLDPFGGVALGALDAMRIGCHWVGVELEPKFADLGAHNISNWEIKFKNMPHWGSAELHCGDSRKLLEVVNGVDGVVSSPPYEGTPINVQGANFSKAYREYKQTGNFTNFQDEMSKNAQTSGYGTSEGQLGAMKGDNFQAAVSSPPYESSEGSVRDNKFGDPEKFAEEKERLYREGKIKGNYASKEAILKSMERATKQEYGTSEGQLGAMKGDNFQAAITSPPFRQSEGGTPEPKPGGAIDDKLYARHSAGNSSAEGYGASEGQLANMKEGDFQATVSSPPFMENQKGGGIANAMNDRGDYKLTTGIPGKNSGYQNQAHTIGNLADSDGVDDFWLAARQIVEQVYRALAPGGHAVWVCKDFVRNKERVEFCDQWRQLCEAVGFETVHEHRAMLIRNKSTAYTLDGGTVEKSKSSKSFFRRLAEKNGSPRIDWEVVWCMVKNESR